MSSHRIGPGRVCPTSTYRLQINGAFTFDDAASRVDYLSRLGVSHLYLSPILEAAPGSTHGYDVLDHTRIWEAAGGRDGFDRLVSACHTNGLGIIVDVVPNHMAIGEPAHLNPAFWSVLTEGRASEHSGWFDVDWESDEGRLLLPGLGARLDDVIVSGELTIANDGGADGTSRVLRYHGSEFPLPAGSPDQTVTDVVANLPYRLGHWFEDAGDLNYRRFFDITSLVAVRQEDPDVFEQTHELLLSLVADGSIDGLRIDHPDGLADPEGYLAQLADRTGDAWVVAEKILEGDEELPDWRCAGTTGYDAALRVQQVLTPDDGGVLDRLWAEQAPERTSLEALITEAKQLVVDDVLAAEVNRLDRQLVRLQPEIEADAGRRALVALLVSMDRYRAYIRPGVPGDPDQVAVLNHAAERASLLLDDADLPALRAVVAQASGSASVDPQLRDISDDFIVRFQQTCGPVMAKGIEDTTFYRYFRLAGANEVGGDPGQLSISVDDFHQWCGRRQDDWPLAMNASTTHDTKRSEDVRARSMSLAEDAEGWAAWLREARELAEPFRDDLLDLPTEYLIWQTVVTAWPLTPARLTGYLTKAIKEAKVATSWMTPDTAYEDAVARFAEAILGDAASRDLIERWVTDHAASERAAVLGLKLLTLTIPGVPDIYQGTELETLTLVDPDNRQPVDWSERAKRLEHLETAAPSDLDDEKLLLTSTVLSLRREHSEWFIGDDATYLPVEVDTPHAMAFARGDAQPRFISVVTLTAGRLALTGWDGAAITLPDGSWQDVLTGTVHSGRVPFADLLRDRPVAALVWSVGGNQATEG